MTKLSYIVQYISDISLRLFVIKAIRSLCYKSNSRISWKINEWNERCIANYLRHEIGNINIDFPTLLGKPNPAVPINSIFIMWWQGERNAPELVKACIRSVRIHAGNHKVIIISQDNINDFIHLPDFIKRKVQQGDISFTHLSDIIRLNLLTLYGGAWIDATVFCAKNIPELLFKKPFYSIHFGKYTKDPSHGRWTTFLLFAQKDNAIVKRTLEYHYNYWCKHHVIVDYIMFDYLISEVISQDETLNKMVDDIPIENEDVFELMEHLEDKDFSIKTFVNSHTTIFYKLSWKHKFKDTDKVISMLKGLLN